MTEKKFLQETNFQDDVNLDEELPERRAKEQIWRQAVELKPRPVHPQSKND